MDAQQSPLLNTSVIPAQIPMIPMGTIPAMQVTPKNKAMGPRRPRSVVWYYFDKVGWLFFCN